MGENSVANVTPQADLKVDHTHLGITLAVDQWTLQKAHKDLRDLLANLLPGRIDTVNEYLATSGVIDHTVVTFKTIGDAMNCAVRWRGVWEDYSKCFLRGPVTRAYRPAVRTPSAGNKTSNVHPKLPAVQVPSGSTRPQHSPWRKSPLRKSPPSTRTPPKAPEIPPTMWVAFSIAMCRD
jgi:hypothetical protein